MRPSHDIVVIGGGHNGLVAACYLARAGRRPLVLERRARVGGAAVTEEFAPGFRGPTLAHTCGALHPKLWGELALARRGVRRLVPDVQVLGLGPDGDALALFGDTRRTLAEIERRSGADARGYGELDRLLAALHRSLGDLLLAPPPSIEAASIADLGRLLATGRRVRGLGRPLARRLLQWLPMPVADLVAEWVQDELLRAMLAGRGLMGTFYGPRSGGSGAVFVLDAIASGGAAPTTVAFAGGPGALAEGLAAAAIEAGATIRTGVDVARIVVNAGRAAGVELADGTWIAASTVVSGVDPKRTLLGLVDPDDLDPDAARHLRHYRCRGTSAKVNVALEGRPTFSALASRPDLAPEVALAGRVHIGPDLDTLERAYDAAKYGRLSPVPYLDLTLPTQLDPGLAPRGRHVMSIHVLFAPFHRREGAWTERRDDIWQAVERTLSAYAPDFPRLVIDRQVLTPADLETEYGLTEGHIHHGEPALDQLFGMRPLFASAPYTTPIAGLYLCGAGTHPGGGVTGRPGRIAAQVILARDAARQAR